MHSHTFAEINDKIQEMFLKETLVYNKLKSDKFILVYFIFLRSFYF